MTYPLNAPGDDSIYPRPGEAEFTLKDKWEIILLFAKNFVPKKVCRIHPEDGGTSYLQFQYANNKALELIECYRMGGPTPIGDLRDIERAERVFKGFLHRIV